MHFRERAVGECLLVSSTAVSTNSAASVRRRPRSDSLLPGRRHVLTGMDGLEHRCDFADFGRWHMAGDIAVPGASARPSA